MSALRFSGGLHVGTGAAGFVTWVGTRTFLLGLEVSCDE